MSQQNKDRTSWLGVCLLVVGIIYAHKYYDWGWIRLDLDLPFEVFTWPGFFVGIGLLLVLLGRGVGVVLMLIGGFFLFTGEFIWAISHLHQWWPLVFILIGIAILAKSTSTNKANN